MKRITFFILSILCFTACNNEVEINNPLESSPQIELIMPDAEEVGVYSTATESECKIETLWVFAFRSNSKQWAEKINVNNIARNGQAAQLLPQLSVFHKPVNGDLVVCIANVALSNDNDTTSISSPNDINTYFRLNKRYYTGGESLPMYGETLWSSGNYTCVMSRAVSKIQVKMGESVSDVTTNFTAQTVTYKVYNFSEEGYIRPRNTGKPITTSPTNAFRLMQYGNATEAMTNSYIHAYRSSIYTISDTTTSIGISTFNPGRQYILLEKNNSPAANTFYRLDFYDGKTPQFLDTKRNHHYIFTINKVRSEGYKSITEAQGNPGSNIEYVVTISDDSKHITSNGQYAIVTNSDTATIGATSGSTPVNTSLIIRREDPSGYSPSAHTVTISNISPPSATFSITAPTSLSGINTIVQGTSSISFVSCDVTFTLGNVNHKVHFKRP